MSKLNRKQLQKIILKEFKMMGMTPMSSITQMPSSSTCPSCMQASCECDSEHDTSYDMHDEEGMDVMTVGSQGTVSREDCCEAVKCLIECCSCPVTKAALLECCEDILSGAYDKG